LPARNSVAASVPGAAKSNSPTSDWMKALITYSCGAKL